MKKDEAKQAIQYLCHEWRKARGFEKVPDQQLVFQNFYNWLQDSPYSGYLKFRTTTSVRYDCELWFDQVFHQASQR